MEKRRPNNEEVYREGRYLCVADEAALVALAVAEVAAAVLTAERAAQTADIAGVKLCERVFFSLAIGLCACLHCCRCSWSSIDK